MKNLFWVALFLCLFSCNYLQKNTTTAFDIATVKNHILKMNETYSDRFLKNDTTFELSNKIIECKKQQSIL